MLEPTTREPERYGLPRASAGTRFDGLEEMFAGRGKPVMSQIPERNCIHRMRPSAWRAVQNIIASLAA